MKRALAVGLCLAGAAISSCSETVCGCTPEPALALVSGRVLDAQSAPVPGAQVRAVSMPAADCHSMDADFGSVGTLEGGEFLLGIGLGIAQDSVCIQVFAHPPQGSAALGDSDTTLLVMDFSYEPPPDSTRIELVLASAE